MTAPATTLDRDLASRVERLLATGAKPCASSSR